MNERTCANCRKSKRVSEFEGVPNKPPDLCYSCWQRLVQERKSRAGYSSHSESNERFFGVDTKTLLLAILVVVVIVGGVLIHFANPCNSLPPADHKVMEYVGSKAISMEALAKSTGLSLRTVLASTQRLEECGKVKSA